MEERKCDVERQLVVSVLIHTVCEINFVQLAAFEVHNIGQLRQQHEVNPLSSLRTATVNRRVA